MITADKRRFKRFVDFYQKGILRPEFIKQLEEVFNNRMEIEDGVVKSWFDYCEEKYGKIEQPQLVKK